MIRPSGRAGAGLPVARSRDEADQAVPRMSFHHRPAAKDGMFMETRDVLCPF